MMCRVAKPINLHIVELHVAIVGAGEQHLRVGREAKTAHWHCMTFKRLRHFTSSHIKDGNDAINGSIGNILAIGTLQ